MLNHHRERQAVDGGVKDKLGYSDTTLEFDPIKFYVENVGAYPFIRGGLGVHEIKLLWDEPRNNGYFFDEDIVEYWEARGFVCLTNEERRTSMTVDTDEISVDEDVDLTADDSLTYAIVGRETGGGTKSTAKVVDTINIYSKELNMLITLQYFPLRDAYFHTTYHYLNKGDIEKYIEGVDKYIIKHDEFIGHQKPKVYILEKTQYDMTRSAFDLKSIDVDIEANYNDDISDVEDKMDSFINDDIIGHGLCLFHGSPAGGKTSYIRHIIQKYPSKPFIFIPPSMVSYFSSPDFTSFLRENKGSVLVIEDAESILRSRDEGGQTDSIANLLQLTDGLLSDAYDLRIIATFNTDIDNIDNALLRKGRLHLKYEFNELNIEKAKAKASLLGLDPSKIDKPMMLGEIYNLTEDNGVIVKEERVIGFGA